MSSRRHRQKRYSDLVVIASDGNSASARSYSYDASSSSDTGRAEASATSSIASQTSLGYDSSARATSARIDDKIIVAVRPNATASLYSDLSEALSTAQPTTFSTAISDYANDALSRSSITAATLIYVAATATSISASLAPSASLTSEFGTDSGGASTGSTGLSTSSKAIVGGVIGGLGGIGLMCALVFVLLTKGNKRKRPESAEGLNTPQRLDDKYPSFRKSSQPSTPSRMRSTLTLVSTRQRPRKGSEPPSPTTPIGFQVISGRRLSSPPQFQPGVATRTISSANSSPRSAYTTPSRRSRLGGTPTIYRDPIGRSQELGSTTSHTSRFIEVMGPDDDD